MEKELTRDRSVTPPRQAIEETCTNGKPTIRHASDKQFRKAHAKISKAHAGLFRRLAQ